METHKNRSAVFAIVGSIIYLVVVFILDVVLSYYTNTPIVLINIDLDAWFVYVWYWIGVLSLGAIIGLLIGIYRLVLPVIFMVGLLGRAFYVTFQEAIEQGDAFSAVPPEFYGIHVLWPIVALALLIIAIFEHLVRSSIGNITSN